ncbi:hypothetical protein D1AOALGA4SA_12807 [Olavius algarvensis Delta 1 endosymbiont]|nr:hypothetical protein D1AOALGA4SA_12807 [Olavius algarvensis Delta 1 endosymbiont]
MKESLRSVFTIQIGRSTQLSSPEVLKGRLYEQEAARGGKLNSTLWAIVDKQIQLFAIQVCNFEFWSL